MASHPSFNANRLLELGESLRQNPSSPLLNRATQGLYPPGAAPGILLYARNIQEGKVPELPGQDFVMVNGETFVCATAPLEEEWSAMLTSGCPGAVTALAEAIGATQTRQFYNELGLYQAPQTYLDAGSTPPPDSEDASTVALGLKNRVSPLQMALAASLLTAKGNRPAPHLVTAINNPEIGWALIPPIDQGNKILSEQVVSKVTEELNVDGKSIWQSLAIGKAKDQTVTWYLAGTLSDWSGTPLTLVILLEEDNPSLATELGQKMIQFATGR